MVGERAFYVLWARFHERKSAKNMSLKTDFTDCKTTLRKCRGGCREEMDVQIVVMKGLLSAAEGGIVKINVISGIVEDFSATYRMGR